ncbi:MAG: hypothetical protein HUU22_04870 [Phycisphaerae bacterium]|nr:type I-E CRISPR-associated protein Cse2/CasB [Phycisphaerae bacterium]NUQ45345.1 hypothetical protein [Phycisphaerae bacterium]
MNTTAYIERLKNLKEGERSRLRSLAGRRLDARLDGFDLFTGLWWPLRADSPAAPRREPSWLVAKLFGAFGDAVPHVRPDEQTAGPTLPAVLGLCEPRRPHCLDAAPLNSPPPDHEPAKSEFIAARKFRTRFDAVVCSALSGLEPHLRWALGEVAKAVAGRVPHAKGACGIDWARLLDDLSIWDRGESHRRGRDIHDIWAEAYLNAADRTTRHQGA